MATSPFMSAFINQLVNTTTQQHQRNEAESQRDVEQQHAVYQELLKSDRPDLQALALTGLTEKPKKDIFGHLKKSPNYEHAQSIIQQMHQQPPAGGLGDIMQPPQGAPPAPPDAVRAQMDAATQAANAAPIPNTPEERAAWQQAPPPPGAAAMSGAQAMTGGGQPQGAPPPNPTALAAGTSEPGGAAAGAPVSGHPADQVHPQGVQSYDEMLALSRAKDPLGLDPMHQQFRRMVAQMQMLGIPVEEGRRLIHDQMMPPAVQAAQLRADTAETVAGTRAKSAADVQASKAQLAKDLASGKYADQQRMEDVKYAHQRALKQLGINASQQRVTWQEVPDPDDPNGVRTVKIPISQATAQGMAASGATLQGKAPGALLSRLTSAIAAKKRIEHVQSYVDELSDHIGMIPGRVSKVEDLLGVQDPVIQRFLTDRVQIAAYMTSVHAARGKAFLDAMEKGVGNLKDNPAAFKTALEESLSGMDDYIDTAKPGKSGPPPSPPASTKDPGRLIRIGGQVKKFSDLSAADQQRVVAAGG